MKPFVKIAVKTAMALGVAGALTMTAATPSLARYRHWGPAVGAGLVAGALLGAAAANANSYYGGPYAYTPGPYYEGPVYDSYAAGPGYGDYSYSSPRYYHNGPNRENQLTGSDAGFIH